MIAVRRNDRDMVKVLDGHDRIMWDYCGPYGLVKPKIVAAMPIEGTEYFKFKDGKEKRVSREEW